MDRRSFVTASAASAARVMGANDRIRGALIGSGNRGRLLLAEYKEIGVEMAAVCDVYEPNLAQGLKEASPGAKPFDNYRRLLEDKSLDIVVIATPDHWHAQMSIDAVQAGKDVYVEKPLAHTIEDGFRMIEAVRRTRRILQVGTQRRSFDLFQEAQKIALSGQLGPVRLVNSWWLNHQASLRKAELAGKLDWEQWLGPAPRRPFDPIRFRNWYYFWDYSGGLLIGQAAHIVDAINMLMNSTYPSAVTCTSAPPGLAGAEVPETCCLTIEYPQNFLAVFTLGYQAMRYHQFNDQMKQFHGSKARFDVWREGYALYPQSLEVAMTPSVEVKRPRSFASATRAHIRNFLDSVRSRQDPSAAVEMGQWTNVVLCMAMESLRKGRRLRWNAAARRVEA